MWKGCWCCRCWCCRSGSVPGPDHWLRLSQTSTDGSYLQPWRSWRAMCWWPEAETESRPGSGSGSGHTAAQTPTCCRSCSNIPDTSHRDTESLAPLQAPHGRREAGASLLPVRLNMKETLIETVYELLWYWATSVLCHVLGAGPLLKRQDQQFRRPVPIDCILFGKNTKLKKTRLYCTSCTIQCVQCCKMYKE